LARLQLAKEVEDNEQELNAGVEGFSVDDHPSVVILNGIRLEDDQYVGPFVDLWPRIDRYSLGGDCLKILRRWDYTQHRSKSPRWPNVQTSCAAASPTGSKSKSAACQKHTSLDYRMQRLNQTASHLTNLKTSPSTSLHPTNSECRCIDRNSEHMNCDYERGEPTTPFMKCGKTFAFVPTFIDRRTNTHGESIITPVLTPQSPNLKRR
jgi:hypothetical protein